MQDKEITQLIEGFIEIQDMEAEPKPHNQDVDLMRSTQQVTIQSPPLSAAKLAPSEEEEFFPLDNGPVMDA